MELDTKKKVLIRLLVNWIVKYPILPAAGRKPMIYSYDWHFPTDRDLQESPSSKDSRMALYLQTSKKLESVIYICAELSRNIALDLDSWISLCKGNCVDQCFLIGQYVILLQLLSHESADEGNLSQKFRDKNFKIHDLCQASEDLNKWWWNDGLLCLVHRWLAKILALDSSYHWLYNCSEFLLKKSKDLPNGDINSNCLQIMATLTGDLIDFDTKKLSEDSFHRLRDVKIIEKHQDMILYLLEHSIELDEWGELLGKFLLNNPVGSHFENRFPDLNQFLVDLYTNFEFFPKNLSELAKKYIFKQEDIEISDLFSASVDFVEAIHCWRMGTSAHIFSQLTKLFWSIFLGSNDKKFKTACINLLDVLIDDSGSDGDVSKIRARCCKETKSLLEFLCCSSDQSWPKPLDSEPIWCFELYGIESEHLIGEIMRNRSLYKDELNWLLVDWISFKACLVTLSEPKLDYDVLLNHTQNFSSKETTIYARIIANMKKNPNKRFMEIVRGFALEIVEMQSLFPISTLAAYVTDGNVADETIVLDNEVSNFFLDLKNENPVSEESLLAFLGFAESHDKFLVYEIFCHCAPLKKLQNFLWSKMTKLNVQNNVVSKQNAENTKIAWLKLAELQVSRLQYELSFYPDSQKDYQVFFDICQLWLRIGIFSNSVEKFSSAISILSSSLNLLLPVVSSKVYRCVDIPVSVIESLENLLQSSLNQLIDSCIAISDFSSALILCQYSPSWDVSRSFELLLRMKNDIPKSEKDEKNSFGMIRDKFLPSYFFDYIWEPRITDWLWCESAGSEKRLLGACSSSRKSLNSFLQEILIKFY